MPELEAVGYGGPEMAAAGCHLHTDLTALAVMWFLRVLLNIHKFLALARPGRSLFSPSSPRRRRADRLSRLQLVDRPPGQGPRHSGVLLRPAADLGLGHRGASKKMRRFVDHVLCSLPFEARWFAQRRLQRHVRRPSVLRRSPPATARRGIHGREHRDPARPLVAILPGSRTQEVEHNLRHFLQCRSADPRGTCPQARFAIAAFKPHQADMARHGRRRQRA